jgi:murein DD-endopeptidase MepM/ murein hydrolase activator NlpD
LFVWLTIETNAVMPRTLRHRLTFTTSGNVSDITVDGARIAVAVAEIPVIGPPLRGDGWLVANGPADLSIEHRRALVVIDGKARISQRFATDWLKFGGDGLFAGDGKKNENWHGYGAEAVAVSDGIVAAVKDGIPENAPETLAVPITMDTIAGNYVSLDLGGGRFALYGHLQPWTLRVKPGDKVRRGQVLGLVGNSGNSDAPHLHFQITDGASPLGSEGLPYEIDSFDVQGMGTDFRLRLNEHVSPRRAELPVLNAVVRF